ncbi:dienelactone hydrolase family protein [Pseudonocardia sp. ICBG1293]|uniref:dienelactone hydrolase family protein n=1 Tax=Pseudonocardia sp. ICBG1293 TaxID=2844382 RepID=UPI001CCF6A8E|nr:acetylxylan esterase [Pseudonocardia sp. ICBG1293]
MPTSIPPLSRRRVPPPVTRTATSLFVVGAVAVAGLVGAGGGTAAPVAHLAHASAPAAVLSAAATVTIDGTQYPNPLRLLDGGAVTDVAQWEGTRRAELLAAFRENVYGQPLPRPTRQTADVQSTEVGDVLRKKVTIGITGPEGTGSFTLRLFVPKGQTPRGTFLMIDHRGSVSDDPGQSSDYAPVSTITRAGYAFAQIDAEQIAPDDSGIYRSKMINLFYPSGSDLPDDAGRAIAAWAWGASRAMDYLQTDKDIDPSKIAVIGHSRSGKAALWAGAQDPRFAAVISNNSGSTGAKLARRGDGGVGAETVSRVNSSFPHWFPQTYKDYGDKVDELPVDQHELMGLVAPRTLVVASATDDSNADPEGEFLAYEAATGIYDLYGLGDNGLGTTGWKPAADTAFRGPAMSYHLRSGGHGLKAADWNIYLKGDLFSRSAQR